MSIAITPSRRSEIEYPDSDGKPMSDNTLQFQWIVTIKEGLEALFRNDPLVFVARRPLVVSGGRKAEDPDRARCHGRVWPAQGLSRVLQAVGRRGDRASGRLRGTFTRQSAGRPDPQVQIL